MPNLFRLFQCNIHWEIERDFFFFFSNGLHITDPDLQRTKSKDEREI